MNIIMAMVFGQVDKHTCGTAPLSSPAEAAVTNASAWGTLPFLFGWTDLVDMCIFVYKIEKINQLTESGM